MGSAEVQVRLHEGEIAHAPLLFAQCRQNKYAQEEFKRERELETLDKSFQSIHG